MRKAGTGKGKMVLKSLTGGMRMNGTISSEH